jgi:purine-binding chemotaxis protein CheW
MQSPSRRWLRFPVAGQDFALPLERVAEVSEARAAHPIPFVPLSIGAVVNLRGEPLPAVDGARLLLGRPGGDARTLLVLEEDGQRVGLFVDQVSRIEADERLEFETEPAAPGSPVRYARAGGTRLALCDAARLVAAARELLTRRQGPGRPVPEGGEACPHAS